ncbi:MAG: class I SAM-dependent methyltransferase [Burkholderiaceae bacterium]|nr:class I SAM-dependent methyltransferase [Burkholderiaceae bacterium]
MGEDLTQPETHFAFGRNWVAYAEKITAAEIAEAEAGLERLLGGEDLEGKRFLDIGCGSGLHSLAAVRLGARDVLAVDIDADSVATSHAVLSRWAPGGHWQVQRRSVFELDSEGARTFDVVYSWGVLHHTGDMKRAICHAAAMTAPGGLFIFALYRRVWMDWFWRWEKRWYAHASSSAQRHARSVYRVLFRLGLSATGRRFSDYVASYRSNRGMDYEHDVHDWLGGWPYESISPPEVEALMRKLGFSQVREFARKGGVLGRHTGLFGSGCDEYVYRKRRSSAD